MSERKPKKGIEQAGCKPILGSLSQAGKNWTDMPLGEFVTLQRGHDLPDGSRISGNIPILGSFGITGWHNAAKAKGPGITVGRSGASFGVVTYSPVDFWPLNTALYVVDFHGNDERFAYYLLRQFDFKSYNSGSAQPSLNRNFVHPVTVSVPPLPEQRMIAHILSTLDDKIELNRKMNETLEAMARALFKSWFVDFDPVRAKAEGRSTGLPARIAALFPDSFEDSELGKIPTGWTVQSLYHMADVIYGAPFASKLFNTEQRGKPLLRIRDLRNETPSVWTPEVHPKGYLVKPGDIVAGMDGEFRAYVWGGEETWLNQRVCVFIPKEQYSSAFVINSIHAPLAEIESTETATTVIHLGKSDIDRFRVIVPTKHVLCEFERSCQPWYDRIVQSKQQSRMLAFHARLLTAQTDLRRAAD